MSDTLTRWIGNRATVRRKIPTPDSHEAVVLKRANIYILPTRQGLIYLALTIVMLLAAINYNNSMTYALAFLLISVAVISLFHTYLNLVGISVLPRSNPACFAGEEGHFSFLLSDNEKRARFQIQMISAEGERAVVDIAAANSAPCSIARPTRQRGQLPAGRVTLASQYPLNLFRAWSYLESQAHILVYPAPSERSSALPFGLSSGDRQETLERGSDDFHGLNNYQPGDSPRHIHWKSWAQGRELLTKQFHRNQSTELWLEWDKLEAGDVEARLSQMCRWVLDADSLGQAYGMRLPGTRIPPARGTHHRHQCLAALALYGGRS